MNRNQRPGPPARRAPAKPALPPGATPAAVPEQHSGEGSASALARLRRLEDSRLPAPPPGEAAKDDPDSGA